MKGNNNTHSLCSHCPLTKITKSPPSLGGSVGQGNSAATGVSCGCPRVRDWLGVGHKRVSQAISVQLLLLQELAKGVYKTEREVLFCGPLWPTKHLIEAVCPSAHHFQEWLCVQFHFYCWNRNVFTQKCLYCGNISITEMAFPLLKWKWDSIPKWK